MNLGQTKRNRQSESFKYHWSGVVRLREKLRRPNHRETNYCTVTVPMPPKISKMYVVRTSKTNSPRSYLHALSDVDPLALSTITALCVRIDWRRLIYWNRISVHHETTIHTTWTPKLSATVQVDTIRGLLNCRVTTRRTLVTCTE